MCINFCFRNKKKIIIEFYKDSQDKLITQLTHYVNDLFKSNYYIIGNDENDDDDICIIFENELKNKLYVYFH